MGSRTKILLGIESVGGGSFKHVMYLMNNLPKDEFDISILHSNPVDDSAKAYLEKIRKDDFKLIYVPLIKKLHFFSDFRNVISIRKLLNYEKYDIVHAHSSKAGFILRIACSISQTKNVYYTPHCFHFQSSKGVVKRISIFYEKLMSNLTTKIIVSTGEYKEAIKYNIAGRDKFAVINNAIDFNELVYYNRITEIKKEFKIPVESNFIVGAIGRLVPQKNWELYIYTAKKISNDYPNTTFLIVGDGGQKDHLLKLAIDLQIQSKVIFLGHIEEINKVYNIIDVLVNTSLWEGLPYTFLEAMLFEKPIVTTSKNNLDITIDKRNAFLCDNGDYNFISERIIELIQDTKKREMMGAEGKKILKKYSFELFIKEHINLYKI